MTTTTTANATSATDPMDPVEPADPTGSPAAAVPVDPKQSFYARWTLRRRVGRWFIALVILLVIAFTTLLVAILNFKNKGDEVIDRWQPAYTLSQVVLGDLVNQETGLRGYALGRRGVFLEPYTQYAAQEKKDHAALAAHIGGRRDLTADLAAFDAAAARWRTTIAEPYIAGVKNGDPSVSTLAADLKGKAYFDRIRVDANRLTSGIRSVREQAKRARIGALTFALVAATVAALLTLGSKLVLWRGLLRSVLRPIEDLAGQTREVAAGAIEQEIVPSGPPELSALGTDVDMMRAQIASELARVERARVRLMERSAELARSNADLEQFAYVASHDLSEPLRKVANFCQLLERQYAAELDDKARQYISFAVDGAKRMQVLITDLLSFSRVGRTTDQFEQVDLDKCLARALTNLDERIVAGGAEIVHSTLPVVPGDPTLLTALLQNLVGNALKYCSPDRPPRIEISAEQLGTNWQFTFADNGIGIDQQYAERIFTIFQRLHLRDQYGGTGIGLALCRKIVEFHRGRIWLGEPDHSGAKFQFTLPEHLTPLDAVDDDEY